MPRKSALQEFTSSETFETVVPARRCARAPLFPPFAEFGARAERRLQNAE